MGAATHRLATIIIYGQQQISSIRWSGRLRNTAALRSVQQHGQVSLVVASSGRFQVER
jgi:hypothetical protein